MARSRGPNDAVFTPIPDAATFELVSDEATFELVTPESEAREAEREEDAVQRMLEKEGLASAEADFLANGSIQYVLSSNVHAIQYLWLNPDGSLLQQLYVTFKDGSLYAYYDVPIDVARQLYHASSYGKAVWDLLRQRGTVYGHQYTYALVSGARVWYDAGVHSQGRHESLPKSGEPFVGYHSEKNWKRAKGMAGNPNAGVNLNQRGGSRKVSIFTPIQAKVGHIKPSGPFA